MIRKLPPPVGEVTIPDEFSPSGLSHATECPLRAVLSKRDVECAKLPSHPAAERGSVFHALLERAGKGSIVRGTSSRKAVEAELERLLVEARSRLSRNPETAHFADLRSTMNEIDWHNKTKTILLAAEGLFDRAPAMRSGQSTSNQGPLEFDELQGEGAFHEVKIRSKELRLAGRMDLVEIQSQRRLIISDYKTGRVVDRDGQVLEHIALQLRLYALAVEQSDSKARVDLRVIEGSSHYRVAWDFEAREATLTILQNLLSNLPAGETLPAEELARPGPWCSNCSFRHVCRSYLDAAPQVWVDGCETGPYPFDIWGLVKNRQETSSGIALDLVDEARRNVRIQRIDSRHGEIEDYAIGERVFLFGLAATQNRRHRGRDFQPRNFFELTGDRSPLRAWSLAVYCT